MYAIVDIETTGGSAKKHRMTEIAIILHDGKKETDRFQTLVNPEQIIPPRISMLTGITNEMVENAPKFYEVAKTIWEMTEDRVFVAHNAHFDYGFIREHFNEFGARWQRKRLCTVRLARKLMPGMYSYSLGKIASQMGETIEGRHRAMGDCAFTSILFTKLLELDTEDHIKFALNARSREATLPPNLPRKKFEALPSSLGIYRFYDEKKKLLYIGKANDIKKRVSEHFRGNTHTGYKSRFVEQITDVDFIECLNELIALLTEAAEIKKHWPPYNNSMKRVSLNWGIFSYYDQKGYGRLTMGRTGKWHRPEASFRDQYEARLKLEQLTRNYELCARLNGLQELDSACAEEVHGKCHKACIGEEAPEAYNSRFEQMLLDLKGEHRNLVICGKGRAKDEKSVILIEKGRYRGHGLAPAEKEIEKLEDVIDYIQTGYDDQDMQGIIRTHLSKKGNHEVILLKEY